MPLTGPPIHRILPDDDLHALALYSVKGALRALASLKGREMNMGAFAIAAGLTDQPARGLRLAFQEAGLVRVTESKIRGATEIRLTLTAKGDRIAKLAIEIARLSK